MNSLQAGGMNKMTKLVQHTNSNCFCCEKQRDPDEMAHKFVKRKECRNLQDLYYQNFTGGRKSIENSIYC